LEQNSLGAKLNISIQQGTDIMQITQQQLGACIGNNPYLEQWTEALNKILPDYEIDTPQRVAAFIAQSAHESGNFTALHENLNYRAETLRKIFPKYFTDTTAAQFAHNPEAIANRVYANRMGNGTEESGDGYKYCGRGLIQLTGKSNYQAFAESIETPVEQIPEFLATFEGAIQSACWFWESNNLNQYADSGDILTMTKRINGGTIGLEDRQKHYNHALHVFGA
jgi:putative chitinase